MGNAAGTQSQSSGETHPGRAACPLAFYGRKWPPSRPVQSWDSAFVFGVPVGAVRQVPEVTWRNEVPGVWPPVAPLSAALPVVIVPL
eukprot:1566305-Pyramimonas_sp.AAC.1